MIENFGEVLKEKRKNKGMSLTELAKKSKTSHSALSLIESDKRNASHAMQKLLLSVLEDEETGSQKVGFVKKIIFLNPVEDIAALLRMGFVIEAKELSQGVEIIIRIEESSESEND